MCPGANKGMVSSLKDNPEYCIKLTVEIWRNDCVGCLKHACRLDVTFGVLFVCVRTGALGRNEYLNARFKDSTPFVVVMAEIQKTTWKQILFSV